ncbi:MAG: hypothetical protein LAO09_10615 [Acidobacteriia bacterium]|nr:hypothetical protein [Terriglobia bacterium]
MDLASQQRKLLGLFKSTYQIHADDDEYIQTVAQSKHLQEAKTNIFLWRVYVLERTCALTFRLLKRLNLLEKTISAFIMECNISPFRETQAPAFLESLSNHDDRLIASVSQFELALLKIKQGDPGSYVVPWTVEPSAVLYSLANDIPLKEKAPEGAYKTVISGDFPFDFVVRNVD